MAEEVYPGKNSQAFWDSAALTNVVEWSVTINLSTTDSSVMAASTTGKTRVASFKGGTASVTCYLDGDNTIDEGAEAILELLRGATNTAKGYAGTAICTGVEDGAPLDGVETVVYNFTFSGEITCTVTEGS